jgi:hypothetical protein
MVLTGNRNGHYLTVSLKRRLFCSYNLSTLTNSRLFRADLIKIGRHNPIKADYNSRAAT